MKDGEKQQSGGSGKGQAAQRARAERSARALRDNLRRRKMQVRERKDCGGATENDPENDPGDSPNPVNAPTNGTDGT